MYKKSQFENATPLVRWLLEYSTEHELTLTELSRQAGLSAGSLRSLIKYPERIPALETCIKLAQATGKPADEIAQMAGLNGVRVPDAINPERLSLLRIYDALPTSLRPVLVDMAKVLGSISVANH